MTILSRIKSVFRREPEAPAVPVLRNKPQCMAWIKGIEGAFGVEQLNGRAVKTIRLTPSGKWEIEPNQFFIASETFIWEGVVNLKGEAVGVGAVADNCLEPWKEDGVTKDEVADLYLPHVPTKEAA